MKNFIVHIGTEKTATTALQHFFASSRQELQLHDIHYPKSIGRTSHIQLTACCIEYRENHPVLWSLSIRSKIQHDQFIQRTLRALDSELRKTHTHNVLISDEHINVHLNSIDQLRTLAAFLGQYGSVGKIAIYLRRQDALLTSMMSEALKNRVFHIYNLLNPIYSFAHIPYRFDYESIISNVRAAFPESELIVRGYNNASDFSAIHDFCSSIPELDGVNIPAATTRHNKSVPHAAFTPLMLVGSMAQLENESSLLAHWREVIRTIIDTFEGFPFSLSYSDRKLFLRRFEAMNYSLIKTFPHLEESLSLSSLSEPEENPAPIQNLTFSQLHGALDSRICNSILASWKRVCASLDSASDPFERAIPVTILNRWKLLKGKDEAHLNQQSAPSTPFSVIATCPVCAHRYDFDARLNSREGRQCPSCGASGRASAIVHYAVRLLHENKIPLTDQPISKQFCIIGLSDGLVYAKPFAHKYSYQNTYYHKKPRLDITNPSKEYRSKADLLISSEVFEHVLGDSQRAFTGAFSVLKPGGYMILTVPFINIGDSKEHYPGLESYRSLQLNDGQWAAELSFPGGVIELDKSARFHGGPGLTLELRLFNRERVINELLGAGFEQITFHDENFPHHGINWNAASRVITARRPLNKV